MVRGGEALPEEWGAFNHGDFNRDDVCRVNRLSTLRLLKSGIEVHKRSHIHSSRHYDDWLRSSALTRKHVRRNYRAKAGIIGSAQQVIVGPVNVNVWMLACGVASERRNSAGV